MSRNFKSDNVPAVRDAIMAAIHAANVGSAPRSQVEEFLAAARAGALARSA